MAAHPWGDGYEAEHEDMNPLSSASHLSFREQDNLHSYSSPPPGPALQDSQFRTQIRDEDLETQDLFGSDEPRWLLKHNLDDFFSRIYEYYVGKGYWNIIVSRITSLLTDAFTIIFSTFLLAFVDWGRLAACADTEESCTDALGLRDGFWTSPSFGEFIIIVYFFLFSAMWLWSFLQFFVTIRQVGEMSTFYNRELHIADVDLGSIKWHIIAQRLVKLQANDLKLSRNKDHTVLDITNRIMRKDNYVVALLAHNMIPLVRLPTLTSILRTIFCCHRNRRRDGHRTYMLASQLDRDSASSQFLNSGLRSDAHRDFTGSVAEGLSASPGSTDLHGELKHTTDYGPPIWGMTLEWNLRFCLVDTMFDKQFDIHPGFLTSGGGVNALRRRFVRMGVINLLLLPFIMLFMVIQFFLKHAEEIHSKKAIVTSQKRWTSLALWKMREYNELSHFFQRRVQASHEPAQKYTDLFPSVLVGMIAQCIAFIAGAVIAILLLLTFADSAILTNVTLFGRTLLWHLAFFSVVLAFSRSFVPQTNVQGTPASWMQKVFVHTHYMPPLWKGRAHLYQVYYEFSCMYMDRVHNFIGECVSILCTPFILMWIMPRHAERIVRFIEESSRQVRGIGTLCKYAMFEEIGPQDSMDYTQKPRRPSAGERLDASSVSAGTAPGPRSLIKERRDEEGSKMKKSYMTFMMHYPDWRPGLEGQEMVASLVLEPDSMYQAPQDNMFQDHPQEFQPERKEDPESSSSTSSSSSGAVEYPPPGLSQFMQRRVGSMILPSPDAQQQAQQPWLNPASGFSPQAVDRSRLNMSLLSSSLWPPAPPQESTLEDLSESVIRLARQGDFSLHEALEAKHQPRPVLSPSIHPAGSPQTRDGGDGRIEMSAIHPSTSDLRNLESHFIIADDLGEEGGRGDDSDELWMAEDPKSRPP